MRLTFLIRNRVGDSKKIVVGQWDTYVLGLASSKTTNKVGVAEDAAQAPAIHLVLQGRGIGLLASRSKLLLAELALTARDAEAVHHSLTRPQSFDSWAYFFDDTAELVTKDIALLELKDDAVQEMHVAATYSRACDLDNGIGGIHDFGLICLNYHPMLVILPRSLPMEGMEDMKPSHTNTHVVLAHPRQRLHLLATRIGILATFPIGIRDICMRRTIFVSVA